MPEMIECLQRSRALAMLDAVLSPEWEGRYYSFNSQWASGSQMASMRDGSGSGYYLLFVNGGAAYKVDAKEEVVGTDSESLVEEARRLMPAELQDFLLEPAFSIQECTRIGWTREGGAGWHEVHPPEIKVSSSLLAALSCTAAAHSAWAEEYYERSVPSALISAFFDLTPLTRELVGMLDPEMDWELLLTEAAEIAYPTSR